MLSISDRRHQLRQLLAGSECITPASVYDPLSARLASQAGFTLGMLAGSVASQTSLALPDVNVLTLTELAEQARRITRASDLSLFIDADHGFGNALSVARTTEELEHAGASGFSIEDTALPTAYGQPDGSDRLISLDEMLGKLRAALAARRDPQLVIAGRSSALKVEGMEGAMKRVTAMAATGVDAIFLLGVKSADEVAAISRAVRLPIIVGSAPATVTHSALAQAGARIFLQGHVVISVAARALLDAYRHLAAGGSPTELASRALGAGDLDLLTRVPETRVHKRDFLNCE